MTTTLDRDDEPTQVMGLVDTTHPIATTSVRAPSVVDLSVHRGPAEQADMGVVPLPTATTVVPPRIRVGGLSPSRESVASGDSMTRTPNRALGRAAARLDTPRTINAGTQDDVLSFWGSLAGSGALVWLLYFQILPFSGRVGFVFCWFFVFLMLYAGVTAIGNPGQVVLDRVVAAVVRAGAYIVFGTLATAIFFTFVRGWDALTNVNFYTGDMAGVRPTDPLNKGGILHAIIGSVIEVGIAIAITLPLGIGAAIYMNEVGGRFSRVVRTIVEAMTALPSIVAGLFIYTVLIVTFGVSRTGIAAAAAISVMMLPIIARSADVVLRVMPGGLREASLALGASKWETVKQVVIPTVRPGLATALILGIARGVGETSPVLLTSGASTFTNTDPFNEPMNSLPLFVFSAVRSGEPEFIARGFGAASVLLVLVLVLFIITRLLARQKVSGR